MKRAKSSRIFSHVTRYVVMLGCGGISLFLLMAGYESVYSRDLPFIDTVAKVNLHTFTDRLDLGGALDQTNSRMGTFGKPETLKVPERALRLDIVPAVRQDTTSEWLARANTMHLLVTKAPRSGNIGMVFLYCRSSFRTIPTTALPKVADNLLIDTDTDWRYVYRVTEVHTINADDEFILADDGKVGRLVIACEDTVNKTLSVIEASVIAVQGVVQQ